MKNEKMPTEVALAIDFGIIIVAAALMGFLASRTGQPTIIAYILTGKRTLPVTRANYTDVE